MSTFYPCERSMKPKEDQGHTIRTEFERLLKNSTYFHDVIGTHRTATAQVVAAFLSPLVRGGHISVEALMATLKQLEVGTGNPSLDGERRHAVSLIRETIQQLK